VETTMIGIATQPSGEVLMCPGTNVGRGLAVVQLPEPEPPTGRPIYSVTHMATGYGVPLAYFDNEKLAIRCARELRRVCSFEGVTLEQVKRRVRPLWREMLKPIVAGYRYLDDMWAERQECVCDG